jgi:hypothetical protein
MIKCCGKPPQNVYQQLLFDFILPISAATGSGSVFLIIFNMRIDEDFPQHKEN